MARIATLMAPFETITGKYARNQDKVKNFEKPSVARSNRFFYGNTRHWDNTNYVALRQKSRQTPYSAAETKVMDDFKTVSGLAKAIYANRSGAAFIAYSASFEKNQEGYKTLWGYIFAKEYENAQKSGVI